jgi:hypothetical protein
VIGIAPPVRRVAWLSVAPDPARERLLLFGAALAPIKPGLITDLGGLGALERRAVQPGYH